MAVRDLEVDVYVFLQRIQLEQFFERIDKVLHLTRLAHFDHVAESDLNDINMSKPEQRRLFDAIKKHKKERKKASKTRFSLRKSKKKDSSNSSSDDTVSQGKSCLISENSLKTLEELGVGAFGVVSKAEWTPNKGSKVSVAVKCLKYSDKDAFLKEQGNFMREASAMSGLDHPNVIHLYGIVLATPIKLVMELATLGSLQDRLRTEPQKFLISMLYDFILQIASGMSYLESKRYVHRDLAARNILVASYDKVKIGDFGLMRQLHSDEDIYVMNPLGKVAVAWCAPECLKNREFSHASDVWAFGVTVIEIFSYGKQPWDGLSGVQILDIIDEPANGRPGKPDHCPDKLYSLLIEHCWDSTPKERSKFSSIKDKLQEIVPDDVTSFYDIKNDASSDHLVAKSGDLITVITWRSRMGTAFAKGQNKRTGEVGYFPTSQVNRNIFKNRGSVTKHRIAKVKDISPPLDNSFSHCAHRGNGETPNWGTIMSDERQVLGKQYALNLPTKLISLNNSDSESQRDSSEIDSCSLMSRDSCNYSSNLSLGRSCADSGYYSNRDTYMSQDYELMTGSNPIAIPGMSPHGRQITSPTPGTFIPAQTRRPSGASLQFDQRCREDSFGSDFGTGSEFRPPLPVKHGAFGNQGNMKQTMSMGFHSNKGKHENTYMNITEIPGVNYEDLRRQSHVSRNVPEEPLMSFSPESVYVNPQNVNSADSLGFINMNYPIIYDRPTIIDRFNCQKSGRCHSFPDIDMKSNKLNRHSYSSEKEMPSQSLNESKSAPILDNEVGTTPNSQNWETESADEALSEDIYENIEIYNVPQAIISDIPPPLPMKRRNSERRISAHRNSGSHDVSKKLALSKESLEEYYSRPVSQNVAPNFDSHLYAEISDKLIEELGLDDQNGVIDSDENSEQSKGSFMEISKDYADLDAICAKLRGSSTADACTQVADNANEAQVEPCLRDESKKRLKDDDVLWKRFSTDQDRIQQHRKNKRGSVSSEDQRSNNRSERRRPSQTSVQSVSSSSLKHSCNEVEKSLHTCTTLVTTV